MIYIFRDLTLDDRLYQLSCAGETVEVEPKVFDLLAYLISHRDRSVTRDELMAQLWADQVISETTVSDSTRSERSTDVAIALLRTSTNTLERVNRKLFQRHHGRRASVRLLRLLGKELQGAYRTESRRILGHGVTYGSQPQRILRLWMPYFEAGIIFSDIPLRQISKRDSFCSRLLNSIHAMHWPIPA